MQLADAIDKLQQEGCSVTANQARKYLKNQSLDPDGDLSEQVIEQLKTLSPKSEGLATGEAQSKEKGALTQANQKFAKTAIAKTAKQMAQVADMETRTGVTAYLVRKTENLQKLTETIEGYSDLTSDDLAAIEAEIDIDALLGEVADPLQLSA